MSNSSWKTLLHWNIAVLIYESQSWPTRLVSHCNQCSGLGILGSRIQQQTKRGGEIFFCPTIFCSHKSKKSLNFFIFEQVKKVYFPKTLWIIVHFTQKFVIKLSKIWFLIWDPGSEIRDPGSGKNILRIPDSRSKRHQIPDPRSGSATLIVIQKYFLTHFH